MDDLLWLLIGLAGGLLLATALPEMVTASRSTRARRHLIVIAAGVVGAMVVARVVAMTLPLAGSDRLTTAAAALAGALWVSGIVGVALARRRRGEDGAADVTAQTPRPVATDMPAYDATRQAMVDGLTEDATAHDAGRYEEVGRRFAAARGSIPGETARATKLHTALRFWRGWMLARDARWPTLDVPGGIAMSEWPQLARSIASDLALDRELSNPRVRDRFATLPAAPAAPEDQRTNAGAVWSHT